MKQKSLKVAINTIFLISIGIPFAVSIMVHRPLIEQLILSNYRTTTSLTLQSMANHIDSYVDSSENFFFQYLFDEKLARFYSYTDRYEITLNNREVFYNYFKISVKYRDTAIKYMASGNDYIKGISFIPEHANTDKVFCLGKNQNSVEILELGETGLEDLLTEVKDISLKQILITENVRKQAPEGCFTMARQINRIEKAKRWGYVFLDISKDMFDTVVSNFKLDKNADVIISYPDGQEAYASSEQIDQEQYYVYSARSDAGFYIDYLISKSTVTEAENRLYFIFIGVWTLVILLAFFLYSRLFKNISDATARIMDFIGHYQLDDKKYEIEQFHENGIVEFDNISSALVDMKKRIGTLVEEEYILKLNQQIAEYKAMQTEINPHFLNNVLVSLMALNRLSDQTALEAAIISLSKMFRYTCEHGYDSTIDKECRFIESYLMLEKLRFEERLIYRIEVEPEVGNMVIPKLLIQPIVENAMKHGFVDNNKMTVQIRASSLSDREKKYIWLTVANNGCPMDKKKLQERSGVGISNVGERLRIVYPDSFMWYSADSVFGTICNLLIVIGE